MMRWHHEVTTYTRAEVLRYCVRNPTWRTFRRRLRLLPTERKLDELDFWIDGHLLWDSNTRPWQVQTSSYINHLKHVGALDAEGRVRR